MATVETLLRRCLHDIFGERDDARRRAAIAELWEEDGVFMDHSGAVRGHAGIDAAVVAIQTRFPDHVFTEAGSPDLLKEGGRLSWLHGRPGQARPIRGVDIIVAKQGRISVMLTFLDDVPPVLRVLEAAGVL